MSHYTNHSIEIQDSADSTATILGSLSQISTPIDSDVQYSETAGTYYPEQVSVAALMPKFSATTFDLPTMIDYLGVPGLMVEEDVGKVGVAIYQAKYTDGAVVAGSNHRRLTFSKSYVMPRRISVSHRSDASLDFEGMAIYDGTNDPIQIETSQALPTLPSTNGRWTIYSVTVGSIAIGCNVQLDIDFGITATAFGCDSDTYDTHLNIDSLQPKISITSLDPESFAAAKVPLLGLAGTHANTSIKLRKRNNGTAGFVANGTAQHIELTANGILLVNDAHNGSGNQRAQTTLEMHCTWDGTNSPFIWDTAATL